MLKHLGLGARTTALSALLIAPLSAWIGPDVPEASAQLGQPFVEPGAGSLAQALDDVEHARSERSRVESELEGLAARRNAARQHLRERVRAFYRLRRAGALPLAGGFEALLRHQARVDRLERIVRRDLRNVTELDHRLTALRDEASALADRLEASERRAASLREHEQQQMDQMQILSGMIADPAQYAAAQQPGGQWSSAPGTTGPGFGIRYADGTPTEGSFAARRGHLDLPVMGSVTLRDAEREGGTGLEIVAAEGSPVRAVARGRVAFASAHPGYGRLVIVAHDGEHYTVYGGLGRIASQVGADVEQETLIGTVGAQTLFFQVRRGTRALAAREWLGI
ncbi:MAG: murein hydrolase activator EnvC [Sandaracinaceae bacterium]